MKKYKLLENDTEDFFSRKLYHIQVLIDFVNAKKGDLCGYIESKKNLLHESDA